MAHVTRLVTELMQLAAEVMAVDLAQPPTEVTVADHVANGGAAHTASL